MTSLPTSGPLSLDDIHVAVGGVSGTICSLGDGDVRAFVGKANGVSIEFIIYRGRVIPFTGLFTGGARTASSLYGLMEAIGRAESEGPLTGGSLTLNGASFDYDYMISNQSATVTTFTSSDWFTSAQDTRCSLIKVFGDLTVPSGVVFQPSTRKMFTVIHVTGDLIVDGTISMTARGASTDQPPNMATSTLSPGGVTYVGPYTLNGFTVKAVSAFPGASIGRYEVRTAFNKTSSGEGDMWISGSDANPKWLAIEFPSSVKIASFSIQARDYFSPQHHPASFSLQASNDESNWTSMGSWTGLTWTSREVKSFTPSTFGSFKHYRLYSTASVLGDGTGTTNPGDAFNMCIANWSLNTMAGNVSILNGSLDESGSVVANPYIPASGGSGAVSVSSSNGNATGNTGGSSNGGSIRATGGGGGGGVRQNLNNSLTTTGGSGAAGTSFSGGSGGGGAWSNQGGSAGNALAGGGAGGAGYINVGTSNNNPLAGGGAGNPGGNGGGSSVIDPPNLSTASGTAGGAGPFTLNGYVVSASSVWDTSGTYSPLKAFNKTNASVQDCWHTQNGSSLPQWIQLQFPVSKEFTSYKVSGRVSDSSSLPRSWVLQGGTNGTTWTTIDTRTNDTSITSGGTVTFTIGTPGLYSYYRMTISATSGGTYASVGQLEFSGVADVRGESGTGGVLVVFVKGTLYGTGTIEAAGSDGGSMVVTGNNGLSGGGGSGGGSVTVIVGQNESSISVSAPGGSGGAGLGSCADGTCPGGSGGDGGDGTASIMTLTSISETTFTLLGGDVRLIDGYQYNTFTSDGVLVAYGSDTVDFVLVGGGGGGGKNRACGGGGGQVVVYTQVGLNSVMATVTIGEGGVGGNDSNWAPPGGAGSGQSSILDLNNGTSFTAVGGGPGLSDGVSFGATTGGSSSKNIDGVVTDYVGGGYSSFTGGGGAGSNANGASPGEGGNGLQVWGTYYGGGGGGGLDGYGTNVPAKSGGLGGGGSGAPWNSATAGISGTNGLGGGGGGGSGKDGVTGGTGGSGGSGVLVTRFQVFPASITSVLPDLQISQSSSTLGTSSIATVATGAGTGGDYFGSVLLPNGNVFLVPAYKTTAGIVNPTTNTLTNLSGYTFPGSPAHSGAVLLNDGRVMMIPWYSPTPRFYDYKTGSVTESSITFTGLWGNGVVMNDGNVCVVPYGAGNTNLAIYNPTSDSVTYVGLGAGGVNGKPTLLDDGRVFMVAGTAARIYDPSTGTVITPGGTYQNCWGTSLLPDGRVFCCSTASESTVIYNPLTDSTTTTASVLGTAGKRGCVTLMDGRVLVLPWATGAFYVYNPATDTATAVGSSSGHLGGASLTLSGKVICPNYGGNCIAFSPGSTLSPPVPARVLLSRFVNH